MRRSNRICNDTTISTHDAQPVASYELIFQGPETRKGLSQSHAITVDQLSCSIQSHTLEHHGAFLKQHQTIVSVHDQHIDSIRGVFFFRKVCTFPRKEATFGIFSFYGSNKRIPKMATCIAFFNAHETISPSPLTMAAHCWWRKSFIMDYMMIVAAYAISLLIPMYFEPYQRFIATSDASLDYPLKEDIVPKWVASLIAIAFPLLVFILVQFWKRSLHDLHHATLSLLQSVTFTSLVTKIFKFYVGRPRPDWESYQLLNPIEARMSFPSAHSSLSAAGLTVLTLYAAANLQVFSSHRGESWRFLVSFSPMMVTFFIACSRTRDVRFLFHLYVTDSTTYDCSITTTLMISSQVFFLVVRWQCWCIYLIIHILGLQIQQNQNSEAKRQVVCFINQRNKQNQQAICCPIVCNNFFLLYCYFVVIVENTFYVVEGNVVRGIVVGGAVVSVLSGNFFARRNATSHPTNAVIAPSN